ncbi:MAG: homoserine dehydrogenase [Clostridia bacterium]|nr:homoserine dehydrogenase [Clostridia bacterium]
MAKVAIMGYGTVGSGVYDIIRMNAAKLDNSSGEEIDIKYILDIRDFDDHPEKRLFTKDVNDIINDDEVTVVAEVMGGLHPAYEFTKSLLLAGKSVVTSNKELVANYGAELIGIAGEKKVNYLFEASVGGGIPVLRPLACCLGANNIKKIAGILNGTTNYILYQMITNSKSFDAALKDAQANGYAERNPAADIEGHDACRKIAILASLASGYEVDYNEIDTEGITNISLDDVKCAGELDSVIKLIGYAEFLENGKIYAHVAPMMIKRGAMLSGVDDVFNAVLINGDAVGDVMFYGPGAGKLPTASAVVADIIDCIVHKGVTRRIGWIKPEQSMIAGRDEKPFRYFIRADKTADISGFGKVSEFRSLEDENVFITEPMTASEMDGARAAVKTAVRILD